MEKDFEKLRLQQTAPKMKAAKATSAGASVSSQPSADSHKKRESTGPQGVAEGGPQKGNNSAKARSPCGYCKTPVQTSNGSTSPEKEPAEAEVETLYIFATSTLRETVVPDTSPEWKDDPGVLSTFSPSVQRKLRVNGMPVSALISTGSRNTRLHSRFICPAQYLRGETITLQSFGCEAVTVPRARVTIELGGHAIPMKVAVCDDLPIGCVIGCDMLPWTGITINC